MSSAAVLTARHRWWTAEPDRLENDLADLATVTPDLTWRGNGTWTGEVPLWPFSRPQPPGLRMLLPEPLRILVIASAAHPLAEPAVHPLNVDVDIVRRLDHRWHVSGDGRLCLTQGPLVWKANDRLSDLVLKAAGWRCELALLQAGVVERMTESGIVTDASRDYLFAYAAQMAGEAW